ncbi:MAG: 5,6,7,8-tetrahydromethanopterin hydro-lyase [Actinomycetota bacterium]
MIVGEAFVGSGDEAAHLNVVLGPADDGPVATAWATALATPSAGHQPFMVVIEPGTPVRPYTLFVSKATLVGDAHARLTWGPAQAGVAAGVADAVASGTIDGDGVLIAAVWVDPAASDADLVFENNRTATAQALEAAVSGTPGPDEAVERRDRAWNPFFRAPGA